VTTGPVRTAPPVAGQMTRTDQSGMATVEPSGVPPPIVDWCCASLGRGPGAALVSAPSPVPERLSRQAAPLASFTWLSAPTAPRAASARSSER
jgi:hypothetical protein